MMTAKQRGQLLAFIFVTLIIAGIVIFFSWIMTRGVVDPPQDPEKNSSPTTSEPVETNPEETNVEGGNTGAGTGESNTDGTETPSPAGGVDTNRDTRE
jgi:hypothetical protein